MGRTQDAQLDAPTVDIEAAGHQRLLAGEIEVEAEVGGPGVSVRNRQLQDARRQNVRRQNVRRQDLRRHPERGKTSSTRGNTLWPTDTSHCSPKRSKLSRSSPGPW